MNAPTRTRPIVPILAIALTSLFLLAPQASAAERVPPLASTPQYRALVDYVAKLRGLHGKPATAGQKATYERQLTSKHGAAVNRSTSLFQRAKASSKAEAQRRVRAAAGKIRRAEAAELSELRAEYADKLADATAAFQRSVDAVERRFDSRYDVLRRQILELRKKKAKAKGLAAKDRVQAQINVLIQEVADSHKQEREATGRLKDRFAKQKKVISTAKVAATTEVRENRQDALDAARERANRATEAKLASLRARRANQLADLESKLNAGRAHIATMPVSG